MGSCLRQPRRKRSSRLIFLADAGRDRRLLLYRPCARRCALLRRNQRQYLQVAAPLDGQVRGSTATASSRCSCCSCRCCMMAELYRRRSCKLSSGAAARPPPPPQRRMHRFNVLPEALQACCMCLANPIPVEALSNNTSRYKSSAGSASYWFQNRMQENISCSAKVLRISGPQATQSTGCTYDSTFVNVHIDRCLTSTSQEISTKRRGTCLAHALQQMVYVTQLAVVRSQGRCVGDIS